MTPEPTLPKVFISYAWKNQPLAKQLQRDLMRDGVEVFIDYEKISGGDSLPARIGAGLEWCNTLVLLWSAEAAESYYVSQEWMSAFHLRRRIVPCVLDDTELPALLRNKLYLNFSSYETGYAELQRALLAESSTPTTRPKSTFDAITSKLKRKKRPSDKAILIPKGEPSIDAPAPAWRRWKTPNITFALIIIIVAAIVFGVRLLCQPSSDVEPGATSAAADSGVVHLVSHTGMDLDGGSL